MTAKLSSTAIATRRNYAELLRAPTPELLAWFDGLTDDDIAAQIADDPDMAPELDDDWYRRAHKVGDWPVGPEPAASVARRAAFKDAAE